MSKPARFAHVPALDGLRGLSVLGPLLFHARPTALPGGFLTIDLFFVLSSYLIISLALNEWDRTDGFNVAAYAGRRARRLLPALFLCALALSTYLAITAHQNQIPRWTGGIVAALAYVSNWHEIYANVSYFEQFAFPSPVYHTWSLAIEEQFYVIVPFVFLLAMRVVRRHSKAVLGLGALFAAFASAAWMAHLYTGGDPSRVYYGTDTRAQGLLVGIALAVAVNLWGPVRTERGRRACVAGAYVGAAYLVYAVFNQSEHTAWLFERGGFLALAAAASLVIVGVSQSSSDPLHRLLAASPTRALGRITYGVYLYHWPLFLLVITPHRLAASPWWTVAALALAIAVATVSYVVIERPVMRRQWPIVHTPATPWGLLGAGGMLVALCAGTLGIANARHHDTTVRPLPIPTAPAASGATGATDVAAPAARPLRVLVIGDSLMLEVGVTLEKYAAAHPEQLVVYTHTHLGCPIARGGERREADGSTTQVPADCNTWAAAGTEASVLRGTLSYPTVVEQFRPDVVLGLITPWDVSDRRLVAGGPWQHVGETAYDQFVQSEYRLATEQLGATGARVAWLLGPHVNRPFSPQHDPARIDRLNELVRAALANQPRVSFVDYPAWLGPVGEAREEQFRDDGVHLTQAGLDAIVPWLMDEVLPTLTPS